MSIEVEGLGPLVDLATALGLVGDDGQFDTEWFASPGDHVGNMLRKPAQRDAFLRAANELLAKGAPPVVDAAGRRWVQVFAEDPVSFHVVVSVSGTTTELGFGVRLDTASPESHVTTYIPLLHIPQSGTATVAFANGTGRVAVDAGVVFDGAPPGPGETALKALHVGAEVATDGSAPKLSVRLLGLQLPGQSTPTDVSLDGDPSELEQQAIRVVLGLIQRSVAGASSELAQILAMVGISDDAAIPQLPIADMFERGLPAWGTWLDTLLADSAAIDAWLDHLALLVGHGATVVRASSAGLPHRVRWTLASGLTLAVVVRAGRTAGGDPSLEIGVEGLLTVNGPPPGSLELDVSLARITLGAAPTLLGLPSLSVAGRVGPRAIAVPADRLFDLPNPAPKIGSLRVGIALDEARRVVLVIAAHDVVVGQHSYPSLDLTNAQTLADVGTTALTDLSTDLLAHLGPAGAAVGTLLGIAAPPGPAWPVPLTTLPDLIANPLSAFVSYHSRVLETNRAGYAAVIDPLRALLAPAGLNVPISGVGDEARPWRIVLASGNPSVAIVAWATTSRLELGVAVAGSVTDLGGSCPTVRLELLARLASIALDGGSSHALPGVASSIMFGARGGVPLRIGDATAAIVADRAGVELRWTPDAGLRAAVALPGLAAEIDGEPAPFALPQVDANGRLTGSIPWRALELLFGHVLIELGPEWAQELADLVGWIPGEAADRGRLPLESLVLDPVGALQVWAAEQVRQGRLADLAQRISIAITGSTIPGVSVGICRGRGDVDSPFAIPVAGGTGALRVEALMWSPAVARDVGALAPGNVAAAIGSRARDGDAAQRIAGALAGAAAAHEAVADLLTDRLDLGDGLAALAVRWIDTDGLVRAVDAVLPGAAVHDVENLAHFDLVRADVAGLSGVGLGVGTIAIVGPMEVSAWPGVDEANTIDLTAHGLAPSAFDVSRVGSESGPWLVRLPRRADAIVAAGDDGAAMQAARLARVVDAVVAYAAGEPVQLIAHGAAGHAAAAVASRPGVTSLVTLGTPFGGVGLDVLESQPGAGALQLLAALLPPLDDNVRESDGVGLGRGLVAALRAAYEADLSPLADLAPPLTPPTIPATVDVHCIRGRCGADAVASAIGRVAARGLETIEAVPGAQTTSGVPLGLGVGVAFEPPAAPGEVRITADLALTAQAFAGGADPGLRVRIGIGRAGGWLAGGPDPIRPAGVSRHPSVRRAEIELDITTSGLASSRLVFHEASALGTFRRRWVISQDGSGDPLLPEARVLVGRVASALGPLPASGPIRQLTDLLGAAGLLDEAAGVVTTGATIGFSSDAVRRLLVDPSGLLADASAPAPAARIANALAALLGAPAPAASTPTQVVFQLGGVTLRADVAARTLRVEATSLVLDVGASVTTTLQLNPSAGLSGQLTLQLGDSSAPNGCPVIEVSGAPLAVRVRWAGGGGAMPASVELAPVLDEVGIARLLTTAVPAQLLWAGITFLRSLSPGAVALVDPVLAAFGLITGTGSDTRVVVPTSLLADPVHWLSHPAIFGSGAALDPVRVSSFADAIASLLNIPRPRPGAWTLPYGMEFATGNVGNRLALSLGMAQPIANTGLRVAGSLGLVLGDAGAAASPTAELTLAIPDRRADRVLRPRDALDWSIRLRGAARDAGERHRSAALPERARAGRGRAAPRRRPRSRMPCRSCSMRSPGCLPPIPRARWASRSPVSATGWVCASAETSPARRFQRWPPILRPSSRQRLEQNLPATFDAISALLAPALPAGYTLARSGNDLVFAHTGGTVPFELRATVPVGNLPKGLKLSGSISGVHPFAGAALGGRLAIDSTGLAEASATFGVDPANGIDLGPLSLAPVAEIAIGSSPTGGARVGAGLAVDATHNLVGVLRFGPPVTFALENTGPGPLAETLVRLLLPTAFDIALSTSEVQSLLNTVVFGGATIRELLEGSVLQGNALDKGILDPNQLWTRLLTLAGAIASHAPALPIDSITIRVSQRNASATNKVYGVAVSLPPGKRFELAGDDVTVNIEVDASWITGPPGAEGLVIELLSIDAGVPAPVFGISVRGIGVRVGKKMGPLLDTYVALDSVAVHGLITVTSAEGVVDAGGQLELGNFRISLGGSTGGNNEVASGVMKDSASGGERPEPRFSPALAVQSHGGGPPRFDLRAGPGDGPWWVTIQHGFGPVYIEQVGFGVSRAADKVVGARVMVDGKISFMGIAIAVDDLALGARWPQTPADPPLYDPRAWSVDLGGLGVSADMSGVSIAGGLSKSPGELPDYVGMISLRFSIYGISAYGGYAVVQDSSGKFTSFFIFGAVNAPIGGVPAFFLTGIGAGVGINRKLLFPTDLNEFPQYPFLQALDRTSPMVDPAEALKQLRAYFPSQRGAFWLAAGISFNSFSLIDGIAVIAVSFGDGFELALLGLVKAGLPNPSAALVQIELALIARFSSKDGVLWIQAQLTDNSFLLVSDCRLTGGFAFVTWFKGDKSGQFVVTLGGYHPSFHRDGYPVIPRLGFVWTVSDILVIKGESYFALVSEAVMAGTRFEASLKAGPLFAYLRLGADAIIYFDPFRFEVTAYAELGAGLKIDVDLGIFGHIRITIKVNLHADVLLVGPSFHGKATVNIDVTSATIAFGDWEDHSTTVLAWDAFESKYIRPGGAEMLTTVTGRGALPPSTEGSKKNPTGAIDDPFLVLPEFTLSVSTTAAASALTAGGSVPLPTQVFLAIGPMQTSGITSTLSVSLKGDDGAERMQAVKRAPIMGQFPKGAWGPQSQSEPKPVPGGDTVEAVSGLTIIAEANISPGTVAIDYHQVEIGKRHQLPFLAEQPTRAARAIDVQGAAAIEQASPSDVDAVLARARTWLTGGANGAPLTPLATALFSSGRSAPPQLVPLTYRMAIDPGPAVAVPQTKAPGPRVQADTTARPPRVEAILGGGATGAKIRPGTTVGAAGRGVARVIPKRLRDVRADLDLHLAARLITRPPTAAIAGNTIVASGSAPFTGRAGQGEERRRGSGESPVAKRRLAEIASRIERDGVDLVGGELFVLTTDNGLQDVLDERPALAIEGDLPVRVVVMDIGGAIVLDTTVQSGTVPLPKHTERIALIGGAPAQRSTAGWHASTQLAQVGARSLVGPGCTLTSSAVRTRRGMGMVATAFTAAADAVSGYSVVTTQLPAETTAVAIALEGADRVEGDRGDALDLGLEGASRVTGADSQPEPPLSVVSGSRTINVFNIRPDGAGAPIEITVASGEHVHLAGVVGSRRGAEALADALSRAEVGGTIGTLFDLAPGKARVRWVPQRGAKRRSVTRRRRR